MNEPANFCGFPCDDPDRVAKDRGLPPNPPPKRDPPRKIPGFPYGHHKSLQIETMDDRSQEPLIPRDSSKTEGSVYVNADHEGEDLLRPPYRIENHSPSGDLSDLTVHTDLRHANGQWTYDVHNLYGMCKTYITMMLGRY